MRVVIAEDSVLLREGLVRLLEGCGITVIDAVADGGALLSSVDRHRPDLAIIDVRMPPTYTDEGLRAAVELRRRGSPTAILVLSQYVEESYATELLTSESSGIGYLLKDRIADVTEFLDALRRVAGGGTALDPEVVDQLLVRHEGHPLERLTAREREVLSLMAEGRSNAGIAEAMLISESAVAKHINAIFGKLDLPTSAMGHRRVLAVLRFISA